MIKALLFLILISLILVSGCSTETGKVVETTKLTVQETPSEQNQTPESIEELHKEFAEFEKSESQNPTTGKQNKTVENESLMEVTQTSGNGGNFSSEEQINEPAKKCPSCNDNNSCTKDSCSKETSYECRHEAIIPCCKNGVCEESENWSTCPQDCQKPECNLSCGICEILDNETCSCENITQCIPDNCCPSECDYVSDSDCHNPNLCETDSDCNDNNTCTQDICSGQPRNCSFSPVTECVQDGCCPENCAYPEDSDCPKPSVIFSEIYYDPIGDDRKHEWVEIYNNGTIQTDIIKWRFEENNTQHYINKVTNETTIEPGSYAIIADNAIQFLDDYPNFSGLLFDSSFSLSNTGENLTLRAGYDGEIMDFLSYNSTWVEDNGVSLEKIDLNGPNTQENWNQSLVEKGTPGQKNSLTL